MKSSKAKVHDKMPENIRNRLFKKYGKHYDYSQRAREAESKRAIYIQ